MKRSVCFDTVLGPLTITEEDETITRISFRPDRMALDDSPLLRQAKKELQDYAAGKRKDFSFPVRLSGTPFQVAVYKRLSEVPYGKLLSYGELAEKVGKPGGARAVGGAVGNNPLPFVVPCHRVIASGKKLGGFGPGPDWKKRLLALEGALDGLRD